MKKYLPTDYILTFYKHSGEYVIGQVIGEGASAITYLTTYRDASGRMSERIIKEYYPDGLDIRREKNGDLLCADKDRDKFDRGKARFQAGGAWQNDLRHKTYLKNEIPPLQGIYEGNGTLYQEVTPFEGKTYDRFDSLSLTKRMKICLAAVKSVRQYHKLGYLCLDVKPENIFVLTNSSGEIVTDLIEFVDFDSICSKEEIGNGNSLSFTRVWAAPEQNNLYEYKKISERTDIYIIGELVFWSVFGRHSADKEHRGFSKYPYDSARDSYARAFDRIEIRNLFTTLFRNTLRSFPENRYACMDDVTAVLEKIVCELSQKEYVVANIPASSPFFVGRELELRKIEEYLTAEHILFVCGIGGIGKSTLMKKYCARHAENYDIIIFLQCTGSLQSAFIDDAQFHINIVSKREEENEEEFFRRKLRHLENLSSGKRLLFVIDNYNHTIEEELKLIMKHQWDVIVVSRREPPHSSYRVLNIDAISKQELYHLFEMNLGRKIADDEEDDVGYMIEKVGGHTLIVELLARQILSSYLSVSEAAELMGTYGFSGIAPEKVGFIKDEKEDYDTVGDIITALFDTGALSESKKMILKILSLFTISGVELERMQKLLDLPSKDGFNELDREGWAYVDAGNIRLHPVIAESVSLWQWEDAYVKAAVSVMQKLLEEVKDVKRYADKDEEYRLAEELLNSCYKKDVLCSSGVYRNLLYCTVMALPRYREESAIEYTDRLLLYEDSGNWKAVFKLYDNLVWIYCDRKDFNKCCNVLQRAENFLSTCPNHYSLAMYYNMIATYCDARLNGAYDYVTAEERKFYKLLKDFTDRACYHIKRSRQRGSRKLYLEILLSKACLLIRGNPQKKREIDHIFSSINRLAEESDLSSDSENLCDYHMIRAWYYTYVRSDFDKTDASVKKAWRIAKRIHMTELDEIDRVIVPSANMLLEWMRYDESAGRIYVGIRMCEEYADVVPYMRKKAELMYCLKDIYYYGEDTEKYEEIEKEIDKMRETD